MKKHWLAIALGVLVISISSCKKEDDVKDGEDPACTGCEAISAQSAYDDNQQGVYKGLLLTGTGVGHFRLNVKNGDEQVFMKMIFKRESNTSQPELSDSLKPTSTIVINGTSDINSTFQGGASKTTVYIPANMANNLSIGDFTLSGNIGTGPKPQAVMLKELSTEQVKVFEGTMQETSASSANGKVGFVIRGNKIEGIITNAANTLRQGFNGTIGSDKKFSFSFSGNNSVYSGELTSDTEITGSYTIQGAQAGTFKASRAF